MKLKRLLSPALLAMAIALAGLMVSGCGDDDTSGESASAAGADSGQAVEERPTEAYTEILSGLEKAARSNAIYQAVRRTQPLSVSEEAVIDAFCRTAWELQINAETERLNTDEYLLIRIRNLAEYDLSDAYAAPVGTAMAQLRKDLQVTSIDPALNSRYKKACYRKPSSPDA